LKEGDISQCNRGLDVNFVPGYSVLLLVEDTQMVGRNIARGRNKLSATPYITPPF
jgi:hypothetical protein